MSVLAKLFLLSIFENLVFVIVAILVGKIYTLSLELLYLTIKDLEYLTEFNLLPNVFLYTQTSVFATVLEKLVLSFLYNFHRKRSLLKLKIKSHCQKSV